LSKRFPGRRLSIVRLSGVFLLVVGVVFSGLQGWRWFQDSTSVGATPWMAGYVDVTATPTYAFENASTTAAQNVVLSFVVASSEDPCDPSWGTYYSMNQAETSLDLDRRIARHTQHGGDVVISFGGLLNDELATGCTDKAALKAAYESVIDRYSLSTIDLDIEGSNLSDAAAGQRRAAVIAAIQDERADSDAPLAVWITLPVAPSGLTVEGTDAVAQFLSSGVDLAGVNLMTMDYGSSRAEGQSMADATIDALDATHRQLGTLYQREEIELGAKLLWNKIGVTPMVGQNDVAAEIFSLDDARAVNSFAVANGIGRMSMWSLNRDKTCGSNYPDVSRVSDSCSGVDQGQLTFAEILGAQFSGRPEASSKIVTTAQPTVSPENVADDPANSPCKIWSTDAAYPKDTKVVWHRQVYVAKYWTQGETPDNPVLHASESPWALIGPVLPGETPVPVPTLPAGTYAEWQGGSIYTKGDRVLFDEDAYEAKWWTQGDSPEAAAADKFASPWRMLTGSEITELTGG
jgi:chitinase